MKQKSLNFSTLMKNAHYLLVFIFALYKVIFCTIYFELSTGIYCNLTSSMKEEKME